MTDVNTKDVAKQSEQNHFVQEVGCAATLIHLQPNPTEEKKITPEKENKIVLIHSPVNIRECFSESHWEMTKKNISGVKKKGHSHWEK
jgi:hypothetical protein